MQDLTYNFPFRNDVPNIVYQDIINIALLTLHTCFYRFDCPFLIAHVRSLHICQSIPENKIYTLVRVQEQSVIEFYLKILLNVFFFTFVNMRQCLPESDKVKF